MSQVTIHESDPQVIARLTTLALKHGRSIEEEARQIVREAVGMTAPAAASDDQPHFGTWLADNLPGIGEIELPSRAEPPRFP